MTNSLQKNLLYRFRSRVKEITRIFTLKKRFYADCFFKAMAPVHLCCECNMRFSEKEFPNHRCTDVRISLPKAPVKKSILIVNVMPRELRF